MEQEIISKLIELQHDVLRIVTAFYSSQPLIEKYRTNIERNINELKKFEIDNGTEILLDFMTHFIEVGNKTSYSYLANLLESFLFVYSKSKQPVVKKKKRGRPPKEEKKEKKKRGRPKKGQDEKQMSQSGTKTTEESIAKEKSSKNNLRKDIAANRDFLNEVCS